MFNSTGLCLRLLLTFLYHVGQDEGGAVGLGAAGGLRLRPDRGGEE